MIISEQMFPLREKNRDKSNGPVTLNSVKFIFMQKDI